MQQNLGFLFAAFALSWAGFFGYLFYIQRQLGDTGRRLRTLEQEQGDARPGQDAGA